ncbi:Zn(II)2Cys6 transcription factor [Aspergillus stella-maris]|uniref:Zn(II)2Cys6 transcription factor n=1 Tax=Aspergillus stella-maris TaxID=1810926 RepID=UPI003CCDD8B6
MASHTPVRLTRGRKSRGRGLRTNTGCSTCRKRHLKCDEVRPVCGPCLRVSRQCGYSQSSGSRESVEQPAEETIEQPVEDVTLDEPSPIGNRSDPAITPIPENNIDQSPVVSPSHEHQDPSLLAWTASHGQPPRHPLDQLAAIVAIDHTTSPFANSLSAHQYPELPNSVTSSMESPGPTVNAATVRWFDLLANDAIREIPQMSGWFTGYGHDILEETNAAHVTPLQRATRIVDRTHPEDGNGIHPDPNVGVSAHDTEQHGLNGHVMTSPAGSLEERLWQAEESIQLLPQEFSLFENFVQRISPWIDLFDPTNKFSTFVPHLAMRNAGLLNAILALSSRHLSLNPDGLSNDHPHRETSLQYYYQTLHYVQKAMQYSSYKVSEELLATTLIISTYEMLDDSSQDWQRHLEGVFLIQRSQVIHGDSGGLKAAVWWAWLCQDVWAAFREKRKTLTFWVPKKTYADLSPAEISSRSMFVLSKVINYCSQEECQLAEINMQARVDKARHLRRMLDEWWSHLTVEFSPLPAMAPSSSAAFRPIWIRTPAFAVAVQLHCLAHILLFSHEPCAGGLDSYVERQTRIRQCVEVICGIAITLKDDASCLICSQSLFIAGMFTQDARARECVLDLLESCRRRAGWPVHSFENELKQLWVTQETPKPNESVTYASMLMNRH